MPSITLHFAPGACSRVPLIALETVGIEFETELMVFMSGKHKSPEFKQINSSSKIPVLIVDEVALSQNLAILMWLNTNYPEAKLLPKTETSMEQAQLLSMLAKFPADLHPLVSRIRVPHFFCDLENSAESVIALAVAAMEEQLRPFEATLKGQPWITGSQWSVIDAYLHWVWFRITDAGFDGAEFPSIAAHYQKSLGLPAVKRALERERIAQAHLDEQGLSPKFLHNRTK